MSSEEEEETKYEFWPNILRLKTLISDTWTHSLLLLIIMIVKRWSGLLEHIHGGKIVDSFHSTNHEDLFTNTLLLSGGYILYTICQVFETLLTVNLTSRVGRNTRLRFYNCLMLERSQTFYDQSQSGELASKLYKDCETIEHNLVTTLPALITEIFEVIFGVIYMFSTSGKLTFAVAAMLPVMVVATWIQNKWETPLSDEQSQVLDKSNARASETLLHIKTVRIFGQMKYELASFSRILDQVDATSWSLAKISALTVGMLTLSYHLCLMVTFWFGGNLVMNGEITSGQFLSFCLFALSLSESINYLPDLNSRLISLLISSEKLFSIIEGEDESHTISLPKPSSTPAIPDASYEIKGLIEFKDITFAYPTRPAIKVLENFSLRVQPGHCAAIVGSSGGGKSTLVSLITRLYDLTEGTIFLDGIDIATLDENWLRRQIGVVSQEPVLFSGTIRMNIAYGYNEAQGKDHDDDIPDVPQERLEEVAKQANAHEFISELPDGYDTIVGEQGRLLSAGQRQRIAIARALLRNPKILIADEATSALDNTSEKIVQQALDRLMAGRTCIVIAHRLSTIQNCYPICVVSSGKIVEQGSHFELLGLPGGHYARLRSHEAALEAIKKDDEEEDKLNKEDEDEEKQVDSEEVLKID